MAEGFRPPRRDKSRAVTPALRVRLRADRMVRSLAPGIFRHDVADYTNATWYLGAMPRTSDRSARTLPLSALALKSAGKALKKRGFVQGAIVGRWVEIVGETLAAMSMPERLVFPTDQSLGATLHIKVAGPLALELQHLAPIVIERINGHFGYGAVAAIRLHQGDVPNRKGPARPKLRPLDAAEEAKLGDLVRPVGNADLQAALADLGRAVIASK